MRKKCPLKPPEPIEIPGDDELRFDLNLSAELSAPFAFLADRSERISEEWSKLYLDTFGRNAFFADDRVRRIFEQLTDSFLKHLRALDSRTLMEELRSTGRLFFNMGAPFEEVVLCVHLFQESCFRVLAQAGPQGVAELTSVRQAMDKWAKVGSAVFAISYFRSMRNHWSRTIDGYRAENEEIHKEMEILEKDLFSTTRDGIKSMEAVLSGMNRKLRTESMRLRQTHRLVRALERATDPVDAMRRAYEWIRPLLPEAAELWAALPDERGLKFRVYGVEKENHWDLCDEILADVLTPEHRMLLHETTLIRAYEGGGDMSFIFPASRLEKVRQYAFAPLIKFDKLLGFFWLATGKDVLPAATLKNIERACRHVATALYGIQQCYRERSAGELHTTLRTIDETPPSASRDEALDFYLSEAIRTVGVERASVMLLDERQKELKLAAAKGYRVFPFSGLKLKWGEGIAGSSIKDSKIICISRMSRKHDQRLNLKSLACVPLAAANRPLGVMNLSTLNFYKTFENRDVEIASRIARRLSQELS